MPSESLPDNRDIWRIAAPMILSNVSVPLLGMVDTGVTGHLEDAVYLGAVAIGSTIFGFLYAGFNFLRMGTTGITAQKFGANDGVGLKVALGQALIVALAIAAMLILLQVPIAALAMQLLGPEQEIAQFAVQYFNIRIWSAPATLANYALIGWFIGLQNARVPLYIVLAINVTNIILDLVFVLGLGMTVDGVAAASLIAEFTGLAVGTTFAISHLKRHSGTIILSHLVTLKEYTAFFAVNLHLLVRTMALMFTFAFVTAAGARLGGLVLAANAVLINLLNLMSFALDGFAHAAEALVGKAVGARSRASLERAVALALRWSLYVSVLFSLFFLFGGKLIIRLLTDIPDVIDVADVYLPWLVLLPMVAVWSYLYDGVYVGATRAREMRDIMLVSTFLVFLPAWFLFSFLGNHGLWLALTLFLASRGIGMHLYYRNRVIAAVPV
ncbi:MAG: MATE family efflux transporter [Gammaproteobacteria bacterium]|nr:MATE family efflux transporter [Gammaproteobacteria bacterium]